MNLPVQTDLRASTKLACAIANTHPDRLNEAIHADIYPCAPKTIPGRARSFTVDDIVALRIYQRGLDNGLNAASAGKRACAIREFMQTHPDAPYVFIIETPFGPSDYLLPDFDTTQGWIDINSSQAIEVIGYEKIDLNWHRIRIVHYIGQADGQRIVGLQ